jgi:hypothetical protein
MTQPLPVGLAAGSGAAATALDPGSGLSLADIAAGSRRPGWDWGTAGSVCGRARATAAARSPSAYAPRTTGAEFAARRRFYPYKSFLSLKGGRA